MDSGQVNMVDGLKLSPFSEAKKRQQPHTYERSRCHVKSGLPTPDHPFLGRFLL